MVPENYTTIDFKGKALHKSDIYNCIKELEKLVLDDNNLKGIPIEDTYLLRFLHCTYFNIIEAYKRIKEFHDFIDNNPKWCLPLSPTEKREHIRTNSKGMLQCRDKQGRMVYLARIGKIDVDLTNPQKQMSYDKLWFESVLGDLKTREAGISVLVDVSGYSLKLLKWLTPSNIRTGARVLQLYPCKEFVFHIVNASFLVNTSVKLIWPFISEEIKKQIKFHFNDWSSLHKYIDVEALPPQYGGYGPDINFEELNKQISNE